MPWYDKHIERVPGIIGGKPIIRGTRISVLAVVEYMELYGSVSAIVEALPDLSEESVRAALAYFQDHTHEIEQYRLQEEESDTDTEDMPDVFHLSA